MDRCEECDKVLFEPHYPATQVYCQAIGKRKLKSLGPWVKFTMKSPEWCPLKSSEEKAGDIG